MSIFRLRTSLFVSRGKDNNREIRPTNGAFLQTVNEFWGQRQQKCCKNGRNSNFGGKMWLKHFCIKRWGFLNLRSVGKRLSRTEDGRKSKKNISPTLTRRLFAVVCRRRRRRRFAVTCSPAYGRRLFKQVTHFKFGS